jgi:hypothetical protein
VRREGEREEEERRREEGGTRANKGKMNKRSLLNNSISRK